MIRTTSQVTAYRTEFTNGSQVALADTTADKGGSNAGFRPHELLEAALANCMNITLRMYAEKHGIALTGVHVTVSLDRREPEHPVFRYDAKFDGTIDDADRSRLLAVLDRCPVRKTLSKPLAFAPMEDLVADTSV